MPRRMIDVLTDEERVLSARVRSLRQAARQLEDDVDRLSQRRLELEGVVDSLIMAESKYNKEMRKNQFPVFDGDPGPPADDPSNVPGHPPTDRAPPRTPHQESMRKALGLQGR